MSEKDEVVPEILANDEGFKEIMSLFKEKSFFQRLKSIATGIGKPVDSKEYKEARTNLQRLMAPVVAITVPCLVVLLLLIFGKSKAKNELVVEVEVEQQEEQMEDLQDIDEPPPQETIDDFTPTDIDVSAPDMNVDVTAQVAPDVPVSAQPQAVDAVLPVKSPVVLRNVYGSTRNAGMRAQMLASGGGNAQTEAAVMRALRWLKATQNEDGSWSGNKTAMTGLAILTFLAHGEKPGESKEFGETLRKAMEFLIRCQNPKTGYYEPRSNGYGHAIATYAMCEAYGMTMNPNVRDSADKALELIIKGQNPGGLWDYSRALPEGANKGKQAWEVHTDRNDTSVAGWCAQALKAGMMANFYHDKQALERASKLCVKGFKANGLANGGFGYTSPANGGLTGVGALCMQFHHAANDPYVKNSIDNIISKWKPIFVGSTPKRVLNEKPKELPPGAIGGGCPCYYAYYGTQALFQVGGKRWEEWNKVMWPSYVEAQFIIPKGQSGAACKCGQPRCQSTIKTPYRDPDGKEQEIGHWVNTDIHTDRPVMDTCLAALQMMVYYRYLPTFKQVDVPEEVVADTKEDDDIVVDSNL